MSTIGCIDNSCVFKVLRGPGVGTNGGCRCFKKLISWSESERSWNREEVRSVERDTQRLAQELRKAREEAERLAQVLHEVVNTYDAVAQGAATWSGFSPLEPAVRAALAAKDTP
jgi:K+/H+ antiporter YhaU regulatory subunit KhtT